MKKLIFLIIAGLSLSSCSAISALVSSLSQQCADIANSELDTDLNEECRALENFLDSNTDNLATVTQVLGHVTRDGFYNVSLLVTDSLGAPVTSLTVGDVAAEVSADGGDTFSDITPVDVATFDDLATSEPTTNHLSVVSIVDFSGSILSSDLDSITGGLSYLFENLSDYYRGEFIRFSTDVTVEVPFTDDISSLQAAAADDSYDREYTSLYDAMLQGVTDVAAEDATLKVALLFTDGVDNDSTATYNEVKTLFQSEDIPVCVIGVGFADVSLLQQIADDSGCFFVYKTLFDQLDSAFGTVVEEFNNITRVRLNTADLTGKDVLRLNLNTSDGERTVTINL